jgi:hypothetical protein
MVVAAVWLSLWSSCRFVLFDLHPQSTLRAVARRDGGGCCTIHCCCGGGMAVSTRSTLQASARSGGEWVLECCLPPPSHPCSHRARSSDDDQSGDSRRGEKHDFRMSWNQKGMLLGGGQLSGERSVACGAFVLMSVPDHHCMFILRCVRCMQDLR